MKKILLVEDDEFLRQIIGKKLADDGYDVIMSLNGKDALTRVISDRPDLVLLDLLLPEVDGFEVLQKIKENKNTSSIPVVILSNLVQQSSIDRAMSMGASDYFIKSQFTSKEIEEKIKSLLNL